MLFRTLAAALCLGAAVGSAADSAPGVLRVGTSGDYTPFSFSPADAGEQLDGFDVELARRYADDRGLTLSLVRFRWSELLDDLQRGRFDVAMSGVTIRPERSVAGVFSVPVVRSGAVVLVRDGKRFDRASRLDAAWVRIAVNQGGHLERVARARFKSATLVPQAANAQVLEELRAGRVDAVVTDTLEAPHWEARLPGAVRLGPITRDHKAALMRPDADELAADLDAWLLEREADGSLAALRERWLGPESAGEPVAAPLPALLAAVSERLAVMPLVAEAKRQSGSPVRDPAREARVLAAAQDAVRAAAEAQGRPVPGDPAVRAFYRAQIEAAVAVQEAVLARPPDRPVLAPDLATALRPAILRIGDRIARLLVALPPGLELADVRPAVDRALATLPVEPPARNDLANALVALSEASPQQQPGQESGKDRQQQRGGVANQREAQP